MHELSICDGLVRAVLAELAKLGPPPPVLRTTRLVVGEWRQVVPANLQAAYDVLVRDTPAAGSTLVIETVPVTGHCRQCGWEGTPPARTLVCGRCAAAGLDLLTGTELYLRSLEVDDADGA